MDDKFLEYLFVTDQLDDFLGKTEVEDEEEIEDIDDDEIDVEDEEE